MSHEVVDAEGRLVRREPGVDFDDPDSGRDALHAEMVQILAEQRGAWVVGVINPARRQIAAKHVGSIHEWVTILADSPMVDRTRLRSVVCGFDAGLRGDFISACHILVPQIEQTLRILLAHRGVIPEWLDANGIQSYKLFSGILDEPELKQALGERLHFEVEALLGKKGQNFRNLLAHGLFSDNALSSAEGVYVWYLALRLVLLPIIASEEPAS